MKAYGYRLRNIRAYFWTLWKARAVVNGLVCAGKWPGSSPDQDYCVVLTTKTRNSPGFSQPKCKMNSRKSDIGVNLWSIEFPSEEILPKLEIPGLCSLQTLVLSVGLIVH